MHSLYKVMAAVSAVLLLMPFYAVSQTQEKFKVRMTPVPRDIAMQKLVAGSGSVSATLSGNKLTITGTFEGMPSPATEARIHRGVATGVRGSPFLDLTVTKGTNGTISGSFDLSAEQVEYLKHGKLYIQINSEKAPDGTLWGWLLR
jgi:hypothetical protein